MMDKDAEIMRLRVAGTIAAEKVNTIRRILEADSCACVWLKDYGKFMIPFWGTACPGEGWERQKCRRCQALEVANG